MNLLNVDANAKTVKGQSKGYLTGVLYLAPVRLSGHQVCPRASKGCASACLNTAGRGAFRRTQDARIRKTQHLFSDRRGFLTELAADITRLQRRAEAKGLIPCVRLNGTSDLRWERYGIIQAFPEIQFYDYTKIVNRGTRRPLPPNYHLTFSLAEDNDADARKWLASGRNVAAVFDRLPEAYMGHPVIDGDETDLRFLDPSPAVVGLKAKGKARQDRSGFVRRLTVV
mgnify:CR=1 FL=1